MPKRNRSSTRMLLLEERPQQHQRHWIFLQQRFRKWRCRSRNPKIWGVLQAASCNQPWQFCTSSWCSEGANIAATTATIAQRYVRLRYIWSTLTPFAQEPEKFVCAGVSKKEMGRRHRQRHSRQQQQVLHVFACCVRICLIVVVVVVVSLFWSLLTALRQECCNEAHGDSACRSLLRHHGELLGWQTCTLYAQ